MLCSKLQKGPFMQGRKTINFYSAPQCLHCKRCNSYRYSNSIRLSNHLSVTRRYCVKAKVHYIKTVSGKVVVQSVAFRVVSIYWQGVALFPWYLNARDRPSLEACALHTLRLIAWQLWQISSCQTNVYTIWLSIQQFNQLLNQQLDRLFVQLTDPYSNWVNALLR